VANATAELGSGTLLIRLILVNHPPCRIFVAMPVDQATPDQPDRLTAVTSTYLPPYWGSPRVAKLPGHMREKLRRYAGGCGSRVVHRSGRSVKLRRICAPRREDGRALGQ
jgi:hypothetical protein